MFVGDSQMGSTVAFTAANDIKSVANSARGFVAIALVYTRSVRINEARSWPNLVRRSPFFERC
jgi:hypothetical protein